MSIVAGPMARAMMSRTLANCWRNLKPTTLVVWSCSTPSSRRSPVWVVGKTFATITADKANGNICHGSATKRSGNQRHPPVERDSSTPEAARSWLPAGKVSITETTSPGIDDDATASLAIAPGEEAVLAALSPCPKAKFPSKPRGPRHILLIVSMPISQTGNTASPEKSLNL